MRQVVFSGILFALIVGSGIGHRVPAAAAQTDAPSVIAALRTALGGERKLDAVLTFSAEGSYRRLLGPRELEGSLEIVAQRPDRMRRIEDLVIGGMTGGPSLERVMTLNGDRGWDETNQRGGGGGGHVMMRMGPGPGGPAAGGPGAAGGPPPSPEEMEKFRGRMMKQELDRWLFAFFAASPQAIAHVGGAEAPDGTADVLQIQDDRGQPVRLFVNQQTHLPVMLTFETVRPRVVTVQRPGPQGGPAPDPEAARREAEAQGPPPRATAAIRFSDFKSVDGIMLPHRIEQSIGDEPTEEWVIEKFHINPPVKPGIFEKK